MCQERNVRHKGVVRQTICHMLSEYAMSPRSLAREGYKRSVYEI